MGPSKNVEATLMENMVLMVHRNLKIGLALLPELSRLRRQLQYWTGMPVPERDTWKASHGNALRGELKNVLKKFNLPLYLLAFLEWLFLASDEEITELKAFVRNPKGKAHEAYYSLVVPSFQFGSPFRVGWPTDTGYSVAIMTVEKPGYWQIWGDRGWSDTGDTSSREAGTFSPMLLKQMLGDSGDFVVRGNLDLFDALSWRQLGKFLGRVKKGKGMGKPLGLVAGRLKGAAVRRKRILRDMSWAEIQILVAQQPGLYNALQHEYANSLSAQYAEEFKQSHQGQYPPPMEQRRVRRNAIQNFARYVKKSAIPQVK